MDDMDRPFPPGPRGPEESNVPGPKIKLTPEQARTVLDLAERCSYIWVEDRGDSYLKVTMFDPEGGQQERLIFQDGGCGTANLPPKRNY
jgi:hypothetical protein